MHRGDIFFFIPRQIPLIRQRLAPVLDSAIKKGRLAMETPLFIAGLLDDGNINCSRSFFPLLDGKGHTITFM